MLKRSFIAVLLLCLYSTTVFPLYSQSFCRESDASVRSTPGQLEKHVYKKYVDDGDEEELRIGLVRPVDELSNKKRPLIIGVHSGGFLKFCPFQPCYEKYSENVLAERFSPHGFVTASVEYRLTSPIDFNPPKISDSQLRETTYKAVQDVREATRYLVENADKFGIDTDNIFLLGTSAGAITVLHAAFLNDEKAPKDLKKEYGGLAPRQKIKGVISLAGAIYDLSYLDETNKIPLMVVHGKEDFLVPIDKGFYFGLQHLTPVYGGRAVYDDAVKKGIPATGHFYDFGHSVPDRYKAEVYKEVNNFIRLNLTCPKDDKLITATAK